MIRAGVLRTQPRARFSRIAQLASTRLRRGSDTPRAYVEPVDRRTSVRFRVSSTPEATVGRSLMPAFSAEQQRGALAGQRRRG